MPLTNRKRSEQKRSCIAQRRKNDKQISGDHSEKKTSAVDDMNQQNAKKGIANQSNNANGRKVPPLCESRIVLTSNSKSTSDV